MESSNEREDRDKDRRATIERRSAKDSRSIEERELLGERRVNPDRRSGLDRRSRTNEPQRRITLLNVLVTVGALGLGDVYFFDGLHSTYVLQMIGRDLNSRVMEWLEPAF
jgi:hypothetical protein